jgi:tRNA threonylcarbamoyladenosine biosynthesis protein TsaB
MGEVLLTIDTSTLAGSVALSRGETLLGEIFLNVRATHTDRLLNSTRQLLGDVGLELEQVDAFGVVLGPGSFTGLRVGVATVKGLALGTGRPVLGVSSLGTLAVQVPCTRLPVCALLDARKKEVYAGLFERVGGVPVPRGGERVLSPERLCDVLEGEILFVGDGSCAYRSLLVRRLGAKAHFVPWHLQHPRASAAAALALEEFRQGRSLSPAALAPRYIRPSEAEIMLFGRPEEPGLEG